VTGRQDSGGSTVRRLQLGARLRELRLARGVSREDAGYRIRASESKTREANSPSWWRSYGDVLDSWFTNYLDLEQSAELIRTYEIQFVPGLLQTERYASAVIRLAHTNPSHLEVERRATLRMARKQMLSKPDGPKLWAVLDEAVLRRLIGGRQVMHEQILALLEATENVNIRLQVIPFDSGGHAAAGGAFSILRFPHEELDDVVYIEHLTSAVYLDKRDDIDNYATAFSRLIIDAAPPDETPLILRKIADDLADEPEEKI
jgi:hypothetical protein